MSKRPFLLAVAALVVLGAAAIGSRWLAPTSGAVVAGSKPAGERAAPVEVASAVRKQVPVLIEALGTVTPIASVAIKSRLDSEIVGVHFADGARVKAGDLLFTLDSRALEAQLRQAQAQLHRDRAQLAAAERDVRRFTELVAKGATPQTNLDNAKTQVDIFRAAIEADEALVEQLKVQLGYGTIRAPISGRISAANAKVGSFVRAADAAPLATIIQTAPVYVSFTVPQRYLPEIRQALGSETATVEAIIPGTAQHAQGAVTMIENTVDQATGMVTVRATMPNDDGLLWPGTLVTVQMTVRREEAVVVPAPAVQASQAGPFVFVVKGGTAVVARVKVARTVAGEAVTEEGLEGGETVVIDGHLQLTNGTPVAARQRKSGTEER